MSKSVHSSTTIKRPESFQLKGGLFPMNLLELKVADIEQIQKELSAKVSQAPAFFQNSPVVIGFELLSEYEQKNVPLQQLISFCKDLGLLPLAIRGGCMDVQHEGKLLGLPSLPIGKGKAKAALEDLETVDPSKQKLLETADSAEESGTFEAEQMATKVINAPIRSGQQIYAPNGDLIILSSVSAGAEVLADGNIHIYGALRGRALAGIKGDKNARIFCSSQEAELISIAGEFMVDENLKTNHWKESVQVRLVDNNIFIETL